MATAILTGLTVLLQSYTIYLLYRLSHPVPITPERSEKPGRQFVTPFGTFAVESRKRKTTINDDETLFDRERER